MDLLVEREIKVPCTARKRGSTWHFVLDLVPSKQEYVSFKNEPTKL
jgi:hypothetical protein